MTLNRSAATLAKAAIDFPIIALIRDFIGGQLTASPDARQLKRSVKVF
jgi:hypothetical protein